ncbi:MAG: hypothetical protein RBG13Loki_0767, partial [Promethearchaeota archaeon CR_4]
MFDVFLSRLVHLFALFLEEFLDLEDHRVRLIAGLHFLVDFLVFFLEFL